MWGLLLPPQIETASSVALEKLSPAGKSKSNGAQEPAEAPSRLSKQAHPRAVPSKATAPRRTNYDADDAVKEADAEGSTVTHKEPAPQAVQLTGDKREPSHPQVEDRDQSCSEVEHATADAAEEFEKLSLALSPLEVVYILLQLVPEFQGQEEAMRLLYEKKKSCHTDTLSQTPASEDACASGWSSARTSVEGCLLPDKSRVAPTASFDHSAGAYRKKSCTGTSPNTVTLLCDGAGANQRRGSGVSGRRRSRAGTEQGKEHVRVRIAGGAIAEFDRGEQEDAEPSLPAHSAEANAEDGASADQPEAAANSQRLQQQRWQHLDLAAAVGQAVASRPFSDSTMEKCYRSLLRKILGQRKSSWVDLANRNVTAFEFKWILLKMVEYKTPPSSLAARLSLPARISLLVTRLLKHEERGPRPMARAVNKSAPEPAYSDSNELSARSRTLAQQDSDTSTRDVHPAAWLNGAASTVETAPKDHVLQDSVGFFWKGFHSEAPNGNSQLIDAKLRFLPLENYSDEERGSESEEASADEAQNACADDPGDAERNTED